MKITKRQLKRIIKEERAKLLKEAPRYGEQYSDTDDGGLYVNLTPEQEDALGMLEIALKDCISRGVKVTDIQDTVEAELAIAGRMG
jgi:phenylalanyl-tRNA synthetase beta subunit